MTLDDLTTKWEEERKWKEAHPFRAFPGEAFDFFRYRVPRFVDDLYYEIKWGFQRMFRGFDDRWYWQYERMNAEQTLKVLKWLQKNKHGSPHVTDSKKVISITEGETFAANGWEVNKKFHDRWNKALGLMVAGFEAYIKMEDVHLLDKDGKYDHKATVKEQKRLEKKWKTGATLFIDNYRGLWD